MTTPAIVLAGGRIEAERFAGLDPGIARKALIPVLGRPMFEWVVRALRACPGVGRIVVVGDPALDSAALGELAAERLPEAADLAANLRAGIEALPGARRVLMVSGDLPLLTREALEDLLANAPAADVVFPFVERADVLRAFPGREWIFAETPDGAFTGGSALLFRPDVLLRNWQWVEALLEARRKKPLALAAMFGPVFAVKLLLRRLRVADAEAKLSSLLHLNGCGYRSPFPELAMDVDKYTDIGFVEERLRRRR